MICAMALPLPGWLLPVSGITCFADFDCCIVSGLPPTLKPARRMAKEIKPATIQTVERDNGRTKDEN
jgi:hypothetical protein